MTEQTSGLLKSRYLVIAPDTSERFELGDIFYKYVFDGTITYCYVTNSGSPLQGKNLNAVHVENFPHLFRPLHWWELRSAEEMPGYVKYIFSGETIVAKCERYETNDFEELYALTKATGTGKLFLQNAGSLPATKQEYDNYIQSIKKQ